MFRTVLAALDTSEHAAKTAGAACDIARQYDARLLILHVVAPVFEGRLREELAKLARMEYLERSEYEILQQCGRDAMQPIAAEAERAGVRVELVAEIGDPVTVILAVARVRSADLIVMGRRGAGRLPGLLLGNVPQKVVQLSEVPCLVVA